MIRRYAWALILAGGIGAAGTIAVAANAGASPAANLASTGMNLSAKQISTQLTAGSTDDTLVPGGGRHGGFGRGLSVTAVSGNTITATGRGNQTVTVQVTSSTTYTQAGATAALSDIHAGSVIAVKSASTSTTTTTITAASITILLPTQAGVVTSVSGTTLSVTGFDSGTHTITVSDSTRYQKAGQSATLADITTGTAIVAEGTRNSDGSLSAVRVTIQVPHLGGQVQSVSGTSYILTGRDGTTYTVNATSSTTYVNADGTAATAAAIKAGVAINAEGSLSSDGKTLTAQRITIVPANAGHGHGQHGDGGTGGVDTDSGSSAQSSGTSTSSTDGTQTF